MALLGWGYQFKQRLLLLSCVFLFQFVWKANGYFSSEDLLLPYIPPLFCRESVLLTTT